MAGNVIETAAAQALLDRGAGFSIPAPLLFRLLGRRTVQIVVRRLRLGTLLHLSAITHQGELTPAPVDDATKKIVAEMGAEALTLSLEDIAAKQRELCRAVAACLLNSRRKIALFSRPLGRYLNRHLTADQLQELVMWVIIYGRMESFTNTIKLIGTMKITSPMNLSQETKRSQAPA